MAGAKANNDPRGQGRVHLRPDRAKFAGYGFNKSHSAAYALIAYQTAYLKAHYPRRVHGRPALLRRGRTPTRWSSTSTSAARRSASRCCRRTSTNPSRLHGHRNDRIRFGLAAIKNVGDAALEAILAERTANGPYSSLGEFCGRIDSSKVNRKVIESLIKAGAFDSMGGRRAQYMEILDQCIDRAKAVQRDRLSGQMSLFGVGQPASTQVDATEVELPDIPEWPKLQRLAGEKETVGFFLTGHPLEGVRDDLRRVTDTDISGAAKLRDGQAVRIGGLIAGCKEHKSKKGDRMAFTVLEDMNASIEVIIFPSTFAECAHLLTSEQPLIVTGTVQQGERTAKGAAGGEERPHGEDGKQQEQLRAKVIAQEVRTLEEALEQYAERVLITLPAGSTSRQHMMDLKEELYRFHGTTPVLLTLHFDNRGQVDIQVMKDMGVRACPDFIRTIGRLCGPRALSLQVKKPEAARRGGNGNGRNGNGNGNGRTSH